MSASVDLPRRRNAAATARELLEAARARFAKLGYDRTSVREIAADVGVDQSLVIRYFGSKEKLFAMACPPEPKTYGLFSGPREELPERLLDWLISMEAADGEGQFVNLIQSNAGDAGTRLLQDRLERFTKQLAAAIDAPNAQLRADLVTAWLLGIGVMSRVGRRPSLQNTTAQELGRYILPALASLTGGRARAPQVGVRNDHTLHS